MGNESLVKGEQHAWKSITEEVIYNKGFCIWDTSNRVGRKEGERKKTSGKSRVCLEVEQS